MPPPPPVQRACVTDKLKLGVERAEAASQAYIERMDPPFELQVEFGSDKKELGLKVPQGVKLGEVPGLEGPYAQAGEEYHGCGGGQKEQ